MKENLRKLWEVRAPRERKIIALLTVLVAGLLYGWLIQSGGHAQQQLTASVAMLRAQVAVLPQQAAEIERLRATPTKTSQSTQATRTDLRTLLEEQAGAAGLTRALVKIEATDANQAVVVFGAVAFVDWLKWIESLRSRQVRLDACRIEALSTPGMVSVTATLLRSGKQ
jgi:type II secretory pathway component PulM